MLELCLIGMAKLNWTSCIFSLWSVNLRPTDRVRKRVGTELERQARKPWWSEKLTVAGLRGKGIGERGALINPLVPTLGASLRLPAQVLGRLPLAFHTNSPKEPPL